MPEYPIERRKPLSRREFLRRAGMTGIALPSMAAILAACGNDNGGGAGGAGASPSAALQFARPDNPVTLPLFDSNPPIADGLSLEAGPLRIIGYADYIWNRVLKKFTNQFGAEVEWTVYETPEQMVREIQAHGSDFDLWVTTTVENLGKMATAQLIQPINRTYLPNFDANAWDGVKSQYFDVGCVLVPYTIYSTGIAYRNDLVTDYIAAMDNPYDIFFDTRYAGQTHLLNGARDTLSVPLLRVGESVNTEDPAVLDEAKQMLLDGVSSMNWKFDHVDYNELNNQFAIHHTWNGQLTYYIYYLPQDVTIDQFSWVFPPQEAGGKAGILTTDVFAIPKGAKNPVLAHEMINMLYDEGIALENYSYEGFQPPNKAFSADQVIADGIVPENLRNTLISEDHLPLGSNPLEVQQYELAPATNQLYQQIYTEVTGGV
jgi:spermidine/putrescine transport system substrate-binding protein